MPTRIYSCCADDDNQELWGASSEGVAWKGYDGSGFVEAADMHFCLPRCASPILSSICGA